MFSPTHPEVATRSSAVGNWLGGTLMFVPCALLVLAAAYTPESTPLTPARAVEPPARIIPNATAKPSGCAALALPQDAALGNVGGDPYTFYEFNREEQLAAMRREAEACSNAIAANLPWRAVRRTAQR